MKESVKKCKREILCKKESERKSKKEWKSVKESDKMQKKKGLGNLEMDTSVFRQTALCSCYSITIWKQTALVRHRTARNELRSTNTDIWGNHSRTGILDISASAIQRDTIWRHIFSSCFTEPTERVALKAWKGLLQTSCCCIRDRKTHSGRLTSLLRFKRV